MVVQAYRKYEIDSAETAMEHGVQRNQRIMGMQGLRC
jgi:hypothetical protein